MENRVGQLAGSDSIPREMSRKEARIASLEREIDRLMEEAREEESGRAKSA